MQNQLPAQADMKARRSGTSWSRTPGDCASLEECKALTGGTGFNTPMQIAPSGCTTVTCLEDGWADNRKTHFCSDTTSVVLTFCPNGTGEQPGLAALARIGLAQQEQPEESKQEQPEQITTRAARTITTRATRTITTRATRTITLREITTRAAKTRTILSRIEDGRTDSPAPTPAPSPAPTSSVPPARVPVDAPPVSTKESVAPSPAKTMTQSARPNVIPCEVSTLETPVAAMESPSTIAPNLETSRNSSRTASRVAVDSKKADVHKATSAALHPIYSSRSKASDVRASSTHDGKTDP
ncbi:hypothetical protein PsorP6_012039 [Peronosclerospora sorghi]|uniref:Uncharacterized protein n=1 Tax=Peronosclerospora sorghi TaxID=230839 RepID=A0ACC0WMF0_9STRA|nr:hypothetical protein PsorP6_012039 [Peronosclerospora sorghi]